MRRRRRPSGRPSESCRVTALRAAKAVKAAKAAKAAAAAAALLSCSVQGAVRRVRVRRLPPFLAKFEAAARRQSINTTMGKHYSRRQLIRLVDRLNACNAELKSLVTEMEGASLLHGCAHVDEALCAEYDKIWWTAVGLNGTIGIAVENVAGDAERNLAKYVSLARQRYPSIVDRLAARWIDARFSDTLRPPVHAKS
jgi:hypothetical protein